MEEEIEHNMYILEWKGEIALQGKDQQSCSFFGDL